jgi:ribosome biogenesis GTPase
VLVINKTDLCANVDQLIAELGAAGIGLPVARVSALEKRGLEQLAQYLGPQITIALVGSSGVGKSTLANWLVGTDEQETAAIREHDSHGRHTTTHRELIIMPSGGALIDTPGMREFAVWSEQTDLSGFADVEDLMARCRFTDCQHQGQPGCALDAALASGALDAERLQHYFKLQRELAQQRARGNPVVQSAQRRQHKGHARSMRQHKKGPGGDKSA